MLSVAVGLFMILVVSEMMMYGDVDVSCFMRSQLDSYEWHEYERLKAVSYTHLTLPTNREV